MRIARTSLLVLISTVLALAQQPARPKPGTTTARSSAAAQPTRADVLKFFTAMRIRERMEDVRNLAIAQARRSVRDMVAEELPKATPAQIAELEGMVDGMAKGYTVDDTLEDMVPIYRKHLTKSDLDAVAAFFSTPAGKRFLDKEPLITNEALTLVTSKTQAQVEATMAAIEKRLDEMKEKK